MKDQNFKVIVDTIKKLSFNSDSQKYDLAKVLHQARIVNWSQTKYKTFDNMIKVEINDTNREVYTLIYGYSCMQKFKWSDAAIKTVLKQLGWSRFVAAIQKEFVIKTKYDFINKYYKMPMNKLIPVRAVDPEGDRAYGFNLPAEHANKWDGILTQHGMTIINGRRHGVRDSVISLINTL